MSLVDTDFDLVDTDFEDTDSPALFRALPCFVPLNLPYKRMVRWVLEYWQSGGSQDLNQLKFIVPEGVY